MFEKSGIHTNPPEVAEIYLDVALDARENNFKVFEREYHEVCKLFETGKWPIHS